MNSLSILHTDQIGFLFNTKPYVMSTPHQLDDLKNDKFWSPSKVKKDRINYQNKK